MRNSAPLALMRCFARLMRWATVASGSRNAPAISAVLGPPTARKVSATCETVVSDGWQHSSIRVSVSSLSAIGSTSTGASTATLSSRRRRADSFRHSSVRRREATVISQPFGLLGRPSVGHCSAAASSASWTASSHLSKPPKYRTSAPRTCGVNSRSSVSNSLARGGALELKAAQVHHRPHLDQAEVSLRHPRSVLERALQALALDQEEASQLLLPLGGP